MSLIGQLKKRTWELKHSCQTLMKMMMASVSDCCGVHPPTTLLIPHPPTTLLIPHPLAPSSALTHSHPPHPSPTHYPPHPHPLAPSSSLTHSHPPHPSPTHYPPHPHPLAPSSSLTHLHPLHPSPTHSCIHSTTITHPTYLHSPPPPLTQMSSPHLPPPLQVKRISQMEHLSHRT